ncbi:unnamed protein product, partial [Didymodactylos carnosus]
MTNSVLNVQNHSTKVSIYNPTNYPYYIPEGVILGTIKLQSPEQKQISNSPHVNIIVNQPCARDNIEELIKHIEDPQQYLDLQSILLQHQTVFDTSISSVAKTTAPHMIETLPGPPPVSRAHRMLPQRQDEMYKIVQDLIKFGHIRHSTSNYASPGFLTDKKDGKWRLVVDYKKLNAITKKDNNPLPNMEETIQRLGGGYLYFSKLDLKSGFFQIPIREKDRHETAFITPFGLYEFTVLAQGLKNSPPIFQHVMSKLLESCRKFSMVYLDDIFSKSYEEHIDHLNQVLIRLDESNFQLNPPKCEVAKAQINYLGHTINKTGITPLHENIKAILELKEQWTLKQANKFIGGIAWYRKFIPKFSTVAAPIHAVTNLTKVNHHK